MRERDEGNHVKDWDVWCVTIEVENALESLDTDQERLEVLLGIAYCRFCGGEKRSDGPFGPVCYCMADD